MTWEIFGYSLYLFVVIVLVMKIPLRNPAPWLLQLGIVIGAVMWPVLLLNYFLGIGGKR